MSLLPYATGMIALCMLVVSSSHLATSGWRIARSNLRTRSVRLRQQLQLRRESQHVRLASDLNWQTSTEIQNAWRVLEVVEIVDESADCRSFYLRNPLGADLPDFQPGQFVMLRPALGGAGLPTRCYSLSDAPGQTWWRITVKREQPARSAVDARKQGSLSVWLHDRIGVGDCLLASGPCGEFRLDENSAGPIVLLAAGIGITPLASILKHTLQTAPTQPVHLFFQVQDAEHWPLGEVLHSWQGACPNLSVNSYFSRRMPSDVPAHGHVQVGKFNAAEITERIGKCDNAAYYICGPESWMQMLTSELIALGVPSEKVHFESFGPKTDGQAGSDNQNDGSYASPVQPWSLSFARSGLHLASQSQPATIWEAASDNGLKLPAVCHSGACGTCRQRLLSGQVQYRTRPQCSLADGEVLACVAQPVGDVVVDA